MFTLDIHFGRHTHFLIIYNWSLLLFHFVNVTSLPTPTCTPYASSPTVVLYNCGGLSGDDCSGCLGLSADYRCGYCRPNCILNSLTCGSSVIQAPNFQQCGAVAVTEVSGAYTELFDVRYIGDNCCVCVCCEVKRI